MNWSRTLAVAGWVLLVFLCYATFFWRLGDYGLWDPDEGRSAIVAKELAQSSNLLTLTQNGEPYYDKPVFFYWLAAWGLKSLGDREFALRLPSALAATLIVLCLYAFGLEYQDWRWGLWGGLVLTTSLEFVALGRFSISDMVFTLFFTSALLYFIGWYGRRSVRPVWPFYVFLALATVTKGPVGIVLFCLIVTVVIGCNRRWEAWRAMRLGQGVAVILAVAGPWYLMAALRDPAYIGTFLWKHNLLRFFTSQPGIDHPEPFYYLFLVLLGGFLPWVLYLPAVGYSLWRERDETKLFLVIWAATVLVFFSLSHNKLGTYVLPAFPPLALLTGDLLQRFVSGIERDTFTRGWIGGATVLWLLLLSLISPLAETVLAARYPQYFSTHPPLWPAAVFLGLALIGFAARSQFILPLVASASTLWLVVWFYEIKAPEISRLRGARAMAQFVNAYEIEELRVAALHAGSFSYYLSKPLQVVSHPGEIDALLSETIPTVALVKEKHVKELGRLPSSRLFVWKRIPFANVLVANFPLPDA